jgi:DNA-binding CsgD family transcriptional regulator
VPAPQARWCRYILADVLTESGELDSARRLCAAALAPARQVDDQAHLISLLSIMARVERLAGSLDETKAYLREGAEIASKSGSHVHLANLVNECAYGCAATGSSAHAVTLWAAHSADRQRRGLPDEPGEEHNRAEPMRRIQQELNQVQLHEARERGARMTISAAAELVIMVTTYAELPEPAPGKLLSPRERELVTLVAQGHTNAQIAARLHISVRTVASHLDRIRDKTGFRRRADLTRLALAESLV